MVERSCRPVPQTEQEDLSLKTSQRLNHGLKNRMSTYTSTFLFLCLTIAGGFHSSKVFADDCSVASLNTCLALLYYRGIDITHLYDDVPFWNETYSGLKTRCDTYALFSVCMQRVTPFCNASIQLVLQGVDNAYQYLCTDENMRAYVGNESCYGRFETKEMARTCNRTYMSQLNAYINAKLSNSKAYCRYVDDYVDCLSSGITLICDSKAAKWQNEWIRNLRMPDMELNKCAGWVAEDSNNTVWATALMICLAITTTLMIVGILALIFFIIRRRLQGRNNGNGSSSNPGSEPTPPPYSVVVETPGTDGQLQTHLVDSQSPASSDTYRILGASYPPHKQIILPPPYFERPEGDVPPYDSIPNGELNCGFVDEGVYDNLDNSEQPSKTPETTVTIITTEATTMDSSPTSEA